MSKGYGVDFYGVALYGYEQPVDYSIGAITVTQTDYTRLTLSWQPLNITAWKQLALVRSTYGYVNTPFDGEIITLITPSQPYTSFDDTELTPGKFYYYSAFISLEAPAWNVATAYTQNQIVFYNGLYWRATTSTTGNTPSVTSTFWANTQYAPIWYPAGFAAGLVVNSYGYTPRLYARTPQPYKITTSDIFANTTIDNPSLYNYLSLFGFHLDMTKTEYDIYLQGNNPDAISVTNLDILGQQLGFNTDYLSSPQSRRQRVKNATNNYRLKGTDQSLHNAIASITGWDSVITPSRNVLVNGDVSSFLSPVALKWDENSLYLPGDKVQFSNYDYVCLVQARGQAQQPTGLATSNTWWSVQIEVIDSTTLKDPYSYDGKTGFASWTNSGLLFFDQALVQPGVITGIVHPTDPTIKNWHALGFKSDGTIVPATLGNTTDHFDFSTVWSSGTNYVVNDVVTYLDPDYSYICIKPSGPGTQYGAKNPADNPQFWSGGQWATTGANGAVATPHISSWSSTRHYATGDQVEYFGIIYQAVNDNINSQPSGNYYPTKDWIFIQLPEDGYVASGYISRVTSNTTSTPVFMQIGFANEVSETSSITYTDADTSYVNRFVGDYADLNGNNDNSLAYLNKPWTASPTTAGLWKSSYGMAYVDQTVFAGNTYSFLRYTDTQNFTRIGLTFITDYADPAHYGHGILFRYIDDNNFWYATRQSLYKVSSGVETLQGTWPRFADGDRMLILNTASDIEIRKYTRNGSVPDTTSLFIIGTIAFGASTTYGIIQKYSPSGAV